MMHFNNPSLHGSHITFDTFSFTVAALLVLLLGLNEQ